MFIKNLILNAGKCILGLSLFASSSIAAWAFTEGTDYMILEEPIPNAQGTLIKIFSYDCPFCYKYDKAVTPEVLKKLDSLVAFEPFHLETKGKYGPIASELFAVLIDKDRSQNISLLDNNSQFKKAKFAYYQAYHDKKERWDSGADAFLQTGLDAVGMSKEEFEKAKAQPQVQEMLKRWKVAYDIAKIQGVPAFVVNGKYLIFTKNIKSIDGMVDLIKELNSK